MKNRNDSHMNPLTLQDIPLTRRGFLAKSLTHLAKTGGIMGAFCLADLAQPKQLQLANAALFSDSGIRELLKTAKEAQHWVPADRKGVSCITCHTDEKIHQADPEKGYSHQKAFVKCTLCAQNCRIAPLERGRCRVRMNVDGELKSLVYGRPAAVHVDPIEKKPFFHFMPGEAAFSLATAGCPLSCSFCQNWELSQSRPEDLKSSFVSAGAMVEGAEKNKAGIIAYTYNEPTVFFEYLMDIAKAGRSKGMKNVLISCGIMNRAPLADMLSVLDGIKIDLKGFDPKFYEKVCNASLKPVLDSIRQSAQSGVHLEIVNLVVPTLNDSGRMVKGLVRWVKNELGPDVPLHFTRFHPDFKLKNLPPTPVSTLERCYETAKAEGLHYPYVGNVPGHPGNHTHCPKCNTEVIKRIGFFVTENNLKKGKCPSCKTAVKGVWE